LGQIKIGVGQTINANGPFRTFAATTNAVVQLSHCGHSCILQLFVGLNVGVQTKKILTAGSLLAAFNRRQDSEALQRRKSGVRCDLRNRQPS
jgi:hypothetical protein